jgi:hypothetical protein
LLVGYLHALVIILVANYYHQWIKYAVHS